MCCIDYLATLRDIHQNNTAEDFQRIVTRNLRRVNNKYDRQMAEKIYIARCSLIHNFGKGRTMWDRSEGFRFGHMEPEKHLRIFEEDETEFLHIEVPIFAAEVVAASEDFFRNASGRNDIGQWYSRTIKILNSEGEADRQKGIEGGIAVHGSIHPAFKIFEASPPPSIQDIFASVRDYIYLETLDGSVSTGFTNEEEDQT